MFLKSPLVTVWTLILHSHRHSFKSKWKSQGSKPEWSVFSHCWFCEESPVVCWLPEAMLTLHEPKRQGASISEDATNNHLKFRTKKRDCLYWGQKGENNIKITSFSVAEFPLLSLLVELELDVICTFPKGPDRLSRSSEADSSGRNASRREYQGVTGPTSFPSASCVLQNSRCMQWWALQLVTKSSGSRLCRLGTGPGPSLFCPQPGGPFDSINK